MRTVLALSFLAVVCLPWLTAPLALRLIAGLRRKEGAELNPLLGATAQLCLFYALLFALGYAL